jgi:hypothetical protein
MTDTDDSLCGGETGDVVVACIAEEATRERQAVAPVDWARYAKETREKRRVYEDLGMMIFTLISIGMCVFFFIFCTKCIFIVLLLSACLCPFYNSMNAPLWLAIILLTISGWSFTTGALSVSWSYQSV